MTQMVLPHTVVGGGGGGGGGGYFLKTTHDILVVHFMQLECAVRCDSYCSVCVCVCVCKGGGEEETMLFFSGLVYSVAR